MGERLRRLLNFWRIQRAYDDDGLAWVEGWHSRRGFTVTRCGTDKPSD